MQKKTYTRRAFLQQALYGTAALGFAPGASADLLDGVIFNACKSPLPLRLAQHPVIRAAWQGVDPAKFWDAHAHIAGTGDSGSGIFITPEMHSLWHPIQYLQHKVYLNAACTSEGRVDASYVERMLHLVKELGSLKETSANTEPTKALNRNIQSRTAAASSQAKLMLFAFEQAYDESGQPRPERTAFHVPNNYASKLASQHPDYFEWVCSVHPYRKDALDELEAAAAKGARAVKWLPAAMGIDPASPGCTAFYRKLAQLKLPLICHAGEEKAVHGMGMTEAGNPLKLRHAMDAGVRVVIAHCATMGDDIDLDRGANAPRRPSFELFSRLMQDSRYQNHLFADISAIVQRNREVSVLKTIIERQDWHDRLLNGTDYPLPGVVPLFSLRTLAKAGLLDEAVVPVLNEIQQYNPLLFDFVLKRELHSGGRRLPVGIFHTRDFFLRST